MTKHPIDHDRKRDDGSVAKAYTKIERTKAGEALDPRVKAMMKSSRVAENTPEAAEARLTAFVKIERESTDS